MTQAILMTENQTTGKNMEHEMEARDIWLHGDYYMGIWSTKETSTLLRCWVKALS